MSSSEIQITVIADPHIRQALKQHLLTLYAKDPSTIILDELGLKHGAARIDVVLVNGFLHGFELKSDLDSLNRLPEQVSIYNSALERITIVVVKKHLKRARQLIPNWWGIKLAERNFSGEIALQEKRKARPNPSIDPLAVAKLLWRQEAIDLLDDFDTADGVRSKPRSYVYKRITEVITFGALKERVRQRLTSRTNWKVDAPQMSCGDSRRP